MQTREEWLTSAVDELRPWFQLAGLPLAQRIRVTCGFPSTARRTGAVYECWTSEASADGTMEILISPTLADPQAVFAILLVALCHCTPGAISAKSDAFTLAQRAMAVPGGAPGENFAAQYGEIIASLGAYPHAPLTLNNRPKQTTRMLKAVCSACGFTFRVTEKWASQGMPTCYGPTANRHAGQPFTLEA